MKIRFFTLRLLLLPERESAQQGLAAGLSSFSGPVPRRPSLSLRSDVAFSLLADWQASWLLRPVGVLQRRRSSAFLAHAS